MKVQKILLFLLSLSAGLPLFAQSFGSYSGSIDVLGQKLELIFNLRPNDDGTTLGTLDVPAQGAHGIPVTVTTNTGDALVVDMSELMAKFEGKPEGESRVSGTFTQMGQPFPLVLEKVTAPRIVNRPQTPKAPFPYLTKEVIIPGKEEGVSLAGTISYPMNNDPVMTPTLVVMVTGSGAQNRDEELFEHKPFAVLADYLAREGVATLRYDDRGVGKSKGYAEGMTTRDIARDAEAVMEYARGLGEFESVGILGHSEGGTVAFMLGSKSLPDFVISLAGPGEKGDKIFTDQLNSVSEAVGRTERITVEQGRQMALSENSPWLNFFIDYDPLEDIRGTKVSVLALNGEKDMQVFYPGNLDAIRSNLPKNPKTLVKSYPGLNHLFQHSDTGSPNEYYLIEETISLEVLEDITAWIKSL